MQQFRFEALNIFILEKRVQFCGRTVIKSKKRVKWVVKHHDAIHEIYCTISFKSGKKKIVHNGLIILDTITPKDSLDAVVLLGDQRMLLRVDARTQSAKIQRKYHDDHDQFNKFTNVFSQPNAKVYEKYYS